MAFVQRVATQNFGGGAASVATGNFAASVQAGELILVALYHWSDPRTITVTDTLGNTYAEIGTALAPGGINDKLRLWRTISGSTGTNSVTATSSDGDIDFWAIMAERHSGVDASTPVVGNSGQGQGTPTTADNAVSSGSTSPTAQPCVQWGISINASFSGGAPAAGTGFSDNGSFWVSDGNGARSEQRARTDTTSTAATFTAAANGIHLTRQAFLLDATGGGGNGMVLKMLAYHGG